MARQLWEYLVLAAPAVDQERLNALGLDGWELVLLKPEPETINLVFKRKKVGG